MTVSATENIVIFKTNLKPAKNDLPKWISQTAG